MLLHVLISELISNLASVFFIPEKHFLCSLKPYLATPMKRLILRLFQCLGIPKLIPSWIYNYNPKGLRHNV